MKARMGVSRCCCFKGEPDDTCISQCPIDSERQYTDDFSTKDPGWDWDIVGQSIQWDSVGERAYWDYAGVGNIRHDLVRISAFDRGLAIGVWVQAKLNWTVDFYMTGGVRLSNNFTLEAFPRLGYYRANHQIVGGGIVINVLPAQDDIARIRLYNYDAGAGTADVDYLINGNVELTLVGEEFVPGDPCFIPNGLTVLDNVNPGTGTMYWDDWQMDYEQRTDCTQP